MDAIGIKDASYGADLSQDTQQNTESLALEDVATQLQYLAKIARIDAANLILEEEDVRMLIDSVRTCIESTGVMELPAPTGESARRGLETVVNKLSSLLPRQEAKA